MSRRNLIIKKTPFITVEGGEAVGKSTFINSLANYFTNNNIALVSTREPGGTYLADKIRAVFAQETKDEQLCKVSETFLVAAARTQHVKYLINPSLQANKMVLCDRYIDSNVVYQGMLGGVDTSVIDYVNNIATGGLLPDLTIILECNIDTVLARLNARKVVDGVERYDQVNRAFHEKIMQSFRKRAAQCKERNFLILDSSIAVSNLVDKVVEYTISKGWIASEK